MGRSHTGSMETYIDDKLCNSIVERFYSMGYGNTPLLVFKLNNGSEILAKSEWFNPSGSIKSRPAFFMIMERLMQNDLNWGKIFIEGTSGNTGIAIAEACKALGLRSRIIIPPGTMAETVIKLRETGTDLVITDEDPKTTSTEMAINTALSLSERYPDKYLSLHQHANPMNWISHYLTTGPEIKRVIKGRIDYVAIAMGTGGSIVGLSRFFKEKDGAINIMIQADPNSYIQGIRNFRKAKDKKIIVDNMNYIDSIHTVSEREAMEGIKELAHNYGVMAGFSSGSNFMAAKRIALSNPNSRVLTVFPDSAEKYINLYHQSGIVEKEFLQNFDFKDLSILKGNVIAL